MNQRRVNVRAIVWRDGKILAVKHKEPDGSESPYWAVPGGGLDPLEDLRSGVVREMLEETGVNVKVNNVLFVQQFHSKRKNYQEELEFMFHVEDSSAFDAIDLHKTSHGFDEIARIEFVDPTAVPIMPRQLATLDIAAAITARPLEVSSEL